MFPDQSVIDSSTKSNLDDNPQSQSEISYHPGEEKTHVDKTSEANVRENRVGKEFKIKSYKTLT